MGAGSGPVYAPAPTAPQVDGDQVAHALEQFVASDYARQMCTYVNASPTAYGKIRGMFEEVRMVDNRLLVRLNRPFEQVADKLLDKLAKHLRATMGGQIQRLQYETKSPPTTKTFIVG